MLFTLLALFKYWLPDGTGKCLTVDEALDSDFWLSTVFVVLFNAGMLTAGLMVEGGYIVESMEKSVLLAGFLPYAFVFGLCGLVLSYQYSVHALVVYVLTAFVWALYPQAS